MSNIREMCILYTLFSYFSRSVKCIVDNDNIIHIAGGIVPGLFVETCSDSLPYRVLTWYDHPKNPSKILCLTLF